MPSLTWSTTSGLSAWRRSCTWSPAFRPKRVKAELKDMLKNGSRHTASDPIADESGQGKSSLDDVEVGSEHDRPMWPWELPEGDVQTGGDAANVSGTHTPGQSVADYPQPKKGRRVTAEDEDDGSTCGECGDSIERDPEGEDNRTWHHDSGDSHDHEAEPKSSEARRRAFRERVLANARSW